MIRQNGCWSSTAFLKAELQVAFLYYEPKKFQVYGLGIFLSKPQAWYIIRRKSVYHQRRLSAFASHHASACTFLRLDGITILCGSLRWGSMCALFCTKKLLPIRQKISHEIFREKGIPPHPCQFYTAFKTKKQRRAA